MQIEVQDGKLRLKRELEAGWFQHVECRCPPCSRFSPASTKCATPRSRASWPRRKRKSRPSRRESLGVTVQPTERVESIYVPTKTKKTEFITGTPKEAAAKLVEKLRLEARVIVGTMNILVITEQRDGKWNNTSFETLAAAQQIATDTTSTV